MTQLADIHKLLLAVGHATNHRQFVIGGSLSVIGALFRPPEEMSMSLDVDMYLLNDPKRMKELAEFGENSRFYLENNIFAAPISPNLISAPNGWAQRLISMTLEGGIVALFMNVNDVAVSKSIRGNDNDLRWILSGLTNGVLQAEKILEGLRHTDHALPGETEAAKARIAKLLLKLPAPHETQ